MEDPKAFGEAMHTGARELARRALELAVPTLETDEPEEQAGNASVMLEVANAMVLVNHIDTEAALLRHLPASVACIAMHFKVLKAGLLEGV
jgi:hypothetical protein